MDEKIVSIEQSNRERIREVISKTKSETMESVENAFNALELPGTIFRW